MTEKRLSHFYCIHKKSHKKCPGIEDVFLSRKDDEKLSATWNDYHFTLTVKNIFIYDANVHTNNSSTKNLAALVCDSDFCVFPNLYVITSCVTHGSSYIHNFP